jgi:hypothetical protein
MVSIKFDYWANVIVIFVWNRFGGWEFLMEVVREVFDGKLDKRVKGVGSEGLVGLDWLFWDSEYILGGKWVM